MRISAALLAGGRSERMGQDKRFLYYRDEPFIRRAYRAARAIADDIWVLISDMGEEARLAPFVEGDAHYVQDPCRGSGPLGALVGVLPRIAGDYALLLAVDYPLVTGDFLAQLERELESQSPLPDVLVPMWRGMPQVACAFYRRSLAEPLREAFAEGERSLQRWLKDTERSIAYLQEKTWRAWDEREVFFNVNTPGDYERLRKDVR